MKIPENLTWPELRHRLVLTPEEKGVIIFVIAAIFLGVATKCYRDSHRKPPVKIEKKHATSRHGHGRADSAQTDESFWCPGIADEPSRAASPVESEILFRQWILRTFVLPVDRQDPPAFPVIE